MKVTIEQSESFMKAQKVKGLADSLDAIQEEVTVSVEEGTTKTAALNTINEQKAKIVAAFNELVRRGRESDAYKFLSKCLDNLKNMLHRLVGHIKDLWARIVARIKGITNGTSTALVVA